MDTDSANLVIREAGLTDAKLISALGVTTFYEAYFESDDSADIAEYIAETYNLEQTESELEDEDSTFFVAELDGRAVGFMKMRMNSVPDCLEGENTCELQRIYLIERVWRKGIGRRLIERCTEEARAKGFESIWLGVWENNPNAILFYEKYGFEKTGEYQYYFARELDTNYVMRLKI